MGYISAAARNMQFQECGDHTLYYILFCFIYFDRHWTDSDGGIKPGKTPQDQNPLPYYTYIYHSQDSDPEPLAHKSASNGLSNKGRFI